MATPPGALFLWDSRADTTTTADGGLLLDLTDQSGNAHTAAQGTAANRAIWRTTALNGGPAVDFEGGAARYQFTGAALAIFQAKAGGTIVAVTQEQGVLTGTTADRPVVWFSRGTSSAVRAVEVHTIDPLTYRAAARRLDADGALSVNGGAVTAAPAAEVGLFDWQAGVLTHRTNNTQDGSGAFATSGPTENTASQSAYVGANGGLTAHFDGLLGYLALWDRVLTDAELTSLYGDFTSFGVPAADVTPPSVPANLRTAALGATTADLAWDASTDNVGVTGYEVTVTGPI